MATHFVGFNDTNKYNNAIKVFGHPDFVHRIWDVRAKYGGEFDTENDIYVFAKGTEFDTPTVYSFNDSEIF